jgi:hypothetical protein
MRKYGLWFIGAVLLLVVLAACSGAGMVIGSGTIVEHKVEVRDFDRVEAGGAFQVSIRQSESYSVVIRIDDNLVQCLNVYVSGGTLHIGFKSECWISDATRMEAEVTMPALAGVELSGASRGTLTGFKSSKDLGVNLSGASNLQGDIEAGNVHIDVSGASQLTLTGLGGNLTAEISGASHADLGDFPVKDASIEVSGASSATVYPSGRLDGEASGASHISYKGSPTMGKIETSGGSSINQK